MISIFDAVMGTGKSTAVIESLNDPKTQSVKSIILVPSLSEVERYKEGLSDRYDGKRSDIVALDEDESATKTERFMTAVSDNKTVITTHELFTRLSNHELHGFRNIGEYNLVVDETIVLVGKQYVKDADLKLLVEEDYMEAVDHPSIEGLQYYQLLPKGKDYLGQEGEGLRKTINAVSNRHVYRINKHNVVFVVPPEKLTVFKDVFLLTYLFNGSETNGWLELFGLDYKHQELSVQSSGGGYSLNPHNCKYSGKQFGNLLTVYDHKINDIGTKKPRAKRTPLTKMWYGERTKGHKDINGLKNNTRTFFRNMKADKADMLWTCFKDYREWVRDSRFDPRRGEQTWLQQSERGTNAYADRHFLAFLVNVHPPVELSTFFGNQGVRFDRDTFALSRVLQWTWRSAIRKGEAITLYLPSERMRELVEDWLKK